jgi:hypothetical protein
MLLFSLPWPVFPPKIAAQTFCTFLGQQTNYQYLKKGEKSSNNFRLENGGQAGKCQFFRKWLTHIIKPFQMTDIKKISIK